MAAYRASMGPYYGLIGTSCASMRVRWTLLPPDPKIIDVFDNIPAVPYQLFVSVTDPGSQQMQF